MKVAIAQINIELFNIEKNIEKHLLFIKEAKKQNIKMLLFPELSLTGYFIEEKILDMAISLKSDLLKTLKKESKGIRIILGLPQEKRNFAIYNSSIVLYNEEIEFCHDKINLPTYHHLKEKAIFTPSYELNSFELDTNWKYSILNCADLWNPSLVHKAMLDDTNILLTPFNSASNNKISYMNGWQTTFDFYSMMYATYILGANRVGEERGYKFLGASVIMDPFGKVVAKANDEEELLVADINYKHIRKARYASPNLRNTI